MISSGMQCSNRISEFVFSKHVCDSDVTLELVGITLLLYPCVTGLFEASYMIADV